MGVSEPVPPTRLMALGPLHLWGRHPRGTQSPPRRLVFSFPDCVSPSRIVLQTPCFTPSAESLTHCDAQRHGFQPHHYNWKERKCRDWQVVSMLAAWRSPAQLGWGLPRPTLFLLRPRQPAQSGTPAP